MSTQRFSLFLSSATLAVGDIIRISLTAGSPESWLWLALLAASLAVGWASICNNLPERD